MTQAQASPGHSYRTLVAITCIAVLAVILGGVGFGVWAYQKYRVSEFARGCDDLLATPVDRLSTDQKRLAQVKVAACLQWQLTGQIP